MTRVLAEIERSPEDRANELEKRLDAMQQEITALKVENRVCIVCFSGDWDRLFAALTIATGALSLGQEVHIFFTFWSVGALRKRGKVESSEDKSFTQSMLGKMLPTGLPKAKLSKMNMLGMGKRMMKKLMKKKGVPDITELMQEALEMGVHLHLCDTTACLFGIDCDELAYSDRLNRCGVATFLSLANKSRITMFL